MERVKEGGGEEWKDTLPSFPSPIPIFHFWLSPQFSRGQNTKNSLLPNPTETLATQAILGITILFKLIIFESTKTEIK